MCFFISLPMRAMDWLKASISSFLVFEPCIVTIWCRRLHWWQRTSYLARFTTLKSVSFCWIATICLYVCLKQRSFWWCLAITWQNGFIILCITLSSSSDFTVKVVGSGCYVMNDCLKLFSTGSPCSKGDNFITAYIVNAYRAWFKCTYSSSPPNLHIRTFQQALKRTTAQTALLCSSRASRRSTNSSLTFYITAFFIINPTILTMIIYLFLTSKNSWIITARLPLKSVHLLAYRMFSSRFCNSEITYFWFLCFVAFSLTRVLKYSWISLMAVILDWRFLFWEMKFLVVSEARMCWVRRTGLDCFGWDAAAFNLFGLSWSLE